MLSPYFPVWVIAFISPIIAFLNEKWLNALPNIKPVALFGLCVAATIAVIVGTPLDWPALIEQAIILFGIVAAGYTVTKPVGKLSPRNTAILTAIVSCVFLGLSRVYAQDSLLTTLPPETATLPIAEPVIQTANVWLQWGLGFVGGVLGRLIPRLFRRGA
jgi:hypothetical protein